MANEIKVVELFAGVGGFRIGLEKSSKKFKTIWSNQWEPATKSQHAFEVYNEHFGNTKSININEDISKVWRDVPKHDFLVGGFPCQDYSVAHGNKAKGIEGKKGVLWWEIHKIINKRKPKYFLLENVDRLLNSPTSQRGRDFVVMIRSLNDLGYVVEWKAITASEYGFLQKRRRVFIFGYLSNSKKIPSLEILKTSLLEKSFPSISFFNDSLIDISNEKFKNLADLSSNYSDGKLNDQGIAINGNIFSTKYKPKYNGKLKKIKDFLDKNENNYVYLNEKQCKKAKELKNNKIILRKSKDSGFEYKYSEGKMNFPDDLNKAGRTMLTSEGTINRSSHFIQAKKGIRFLTPIEAERLNGFPDNWTKGKTNRQRYFFMGNALVVDIVEKIANEFIKNFIIS